ncbi:M20 metallopeptidase family protein [Thermohalobacter berrensis]|uniref:Amidohydrolase n=1 Tax=Thermohalobacter berrensis TaxID=99594 RepID=A0A419T4F2_9FIRM|nr:M20 family metallopeptidase [Thermohalobacter berrensis]RKD32434.1 amidohydrolase [Thermohalobacter berrensis]
MNCLDELKKDIIDIRRSLHQIPEEGFKEVKTSSFIKEKLKNLGFTIENVAQTGILAFRKGDSEKGTIAFRADMDGLNVEEKTGVDYASKEKGMMHACGHDGHMAILLGLALYLSKIEKLKRNILLVFQPAEEGPGGAKVIVENKILEKYNVEAIFGLHIYPNLPEGKIGVKPGPMMAQTGELDIKIKAKSGHGAMPHTTIDGIYVATQLVNSYQSIVSRNIEPIEGAVLSIGKIQGGKARNVIAEEIELEGIIRAFDESVYKKIKKRIYEINSGLEKMYGVNIDVEIRDMYPSVVNDIELYKALKGTVEDSKLVEIKPMMIAEDFAYYQKEVPGLFFMLGSRNEKLGFTYPLHSNKFNFNEDILISGVEIYINICKKFKVF